MRKHLHRKLYFMKLNILHNYGVKENRITPFSDELYEKMSNVFISSIPVSFHIKYLKPIIPPGKCYDRSLYMFFCFKDAILVRANVKSLEIVHGKESSGHGWIEIGEYVYDPTTKMRYEKELYYQMYQPTNIIKTTHEEYKKNNKDFYEEIMSISLDDLKIDGKKREDVYVSIPLIKCVAELLKNEEFLKELNEFLNKIGYSEIKQKEKTYNIEYK